MSDSFDPGGLFAAPEPQMYGKTARAMKLVIEHGCTPKDALLMVRNGGNVPDRTLKEFKRKVARYSLTRPAMVKLAHNCVENVLKCVPNVLTTQKMDKNGQVVDIVEQVIPTHTNQLAAAAMVFDRAEPVVRQNINLNGELKDFMPVILDDYS